MQKGNSSNLVDTLPQDFINISVYKNSLHKNAKFCKKIRPDKYQKEFIRLFECDGCHNFLLFERGINRLPNEYSDVIEVVIFTNGWYCHSKDHKEVLSFCYDCYRKHLKEVHAVNRSYCYDRRSYQ